MTADRTPDPAEAIAAALARLRGRRMPQPPQGWPPAGPFGPPGHGPGSWEMHAPDSSADGTAQPRGGWAGEGTADTSGVYGPHGHHGGAHGHHGGRPGEFVPPGTPPIPPWAGGHGRFGGPARLRLLEALFQASGPLSVSEIGERIGVDQPRASRLVQQCADHGLVRREADPDDARRTRIVLTDDGEAILRRFHGDRRAAVDQALASFTDTERAELARLLVKLADGWPR